MSDRRVQHLAITAFATVAVGSYVAQRLASIAGGEPNPAAIIASAHTPYYWRTALATVHGLFAASVIRCGVSPASAHRWLRRAPLWVWWTTAISVGLMMWFP